MSVAVPSARAAEPLPPPAGPAGTSAPWIVLRLSRLVGRHEHVRLAALIAPEVSGAGARSSTDARPPIWPLAARLPGAAHVLAHRAFAAGRITRVPFAVPELDVAELLAVPLDSGDVRGTLVLALDLVDDAGRDALVADARRRFPGAGRSSGDRVEAAPGLVGPVGSGASEGSGASGDNAGAAGSPDARAAIDRAVLDALAEHGDHRSVALAAADRAASALDCRRVTLGIARRGRGTLLAVSGESRPDVRRAVGRALADVVAEAARHGGRCWPDAADAGESDGAGHASAHRRLHDDEGGLPLLSIVHGAASGERVVAILERSSERPFGARDADAVREALGGALALTGELDARAGGIARRLSTSLRRAFGGSRDGVRSPWRAVAIGTALAALALASLVPLPYRVGARVVVEASDRQVLVAQEAGHVRTAHARAGDSVEAGELLATLDDRELVLSLDKWRSELAKNEAEQSRALAARDRVELARLHADARRIEAEIALVEARRARTEIRAPFAGVVLSGDPTRSLGAPVAAGEVLFEIGAGERALSIEIDERDVGLVPAAARTRVRMAASPRDVREARLAPIVPVAVSEDGREVFRVPAVLLDDGAALSPGMQGVARVEAGRRTLLDAWTRALRETSLLLAWRLGLVR